MNLFFPYPEPIKVAEVLSDTDLRIQIKNLRKEVQEGGENKEWYDRARLSLEYYLAGNMELAAWWSHHADLVCPDFLTPEFCDMEKAMLYKKSPKRYAQFYDYSDRDTAREKKA